MKETVGNKKWGELERKRQRGRGGKRRKRRNRREDTERRDIGGET
jgi:hypothetical protein